MTRCPICEREAKHIPPTGDADIFDCPSHGVFKVAGTLIALPKFSWASIPDWERALSAARARTKPGDWPLIKPDDLQCRYNRLAHIVAAAETG